MLVFKTHFDIEFAAYQEIWEKCDQATDLAAMTLGYVQRCPVDNAAKKEEKADSIRRYDVCREALIEVRKKRPFISKDVSDSAKSLIVKCIEITALYKNIYHEMTNDLSLDRKDVISEIKRRVDVVVSDYDRLGELISKRISELYVMNP